VVWQGRVGDHSPYADSGELRVDDLSGIDR
jgi:hypothetical protein